MYETARRPIAVVMRPFVDDRPLVLDRPLTIDSPLVPLRPLVIESPLTIDSPLVSLLAAPWSPATSSGAMSVHPTKAAVAPSPIPIQIARLNHPIRTVF